MKSDDKVVLSIIKKKKKKKKKLIFLGSGSGDQPSGAYIFRPDSQEKHFHNITKIYQLR